MTVTIRKSALTEGEIGTIIQMDALTFDDCPYSAKEILERVDFEHYPLYVAECEDQLVGFIAFMKVQTLHYSGLWTDLVGVHPEYRGRGIARKLIHVGEQLAKEMDVDFRSALVRDDNIGSIKAFESEGYSWDTPFRLYIK
jgi:ribosomal protein S18 acetylase RimI-like enzyme